MKHQIYPETKPAKFTRELIAPCGMNCGTCMAYLREKDKCPGCRSTLSVHRKLCLNKNCRPA